MMWQSSMLINLLILFSLVKHNISLLEPLVVLIGRHKERERLVRRSLYEKGDELQK